jgi:hypothetical protein
VCFYTGNNVSEEFTASNSKKKHCSYIIPEREGSEHLQKPGKYARRHTGDDHNLHQNM